VNKSALRWASRGVDVLFMLFRPRPFTSFFVRYIDAVDCQGETMCTSDIAIFMTTRRLYFQNAQYVNGIELPQDLELRFQPEFHSA
jgi:hypothetical protein